MSGGGSTCLPEEVSCVVLTVVFVSESDTLFFHREVGTKGPFCPTEYKLYSPSLPFVLFLSNKRLYLSTPLLGEKPDPKDSSPQ